MHRSVCKLIIKPTYNACFPFYSQFCKLSDRKFILRPKAANGCKREFPVPKALFHQEAQNNKKILQYEKWGISVQKNKSSIDSSTTVVNGLCFDPFCLSFSHVLKLLSTMSEGFSLKLFFYFERFLLGFIHRFCSPFDKKRKIRRCKKRNHFSRVKIAFIPSSFLLYNVGLKVFLFYFCEWMRKKNLWQSGWRRRLKETMSNEKFVIWIISSLLFCETFPFLLC